MKDDTLGITFRETMAGGFALGETDPEAGRRRGDAGGTRLSLHATITIRDVARFEADPDHAGSLTGHIDYPPLGQNLPGTHGVFNLFSPATEPQMRHMVYELGFPHGGQDYYLAGKKLVRNDAPFDMWKDTTTLLTRLHRGRDSSGPVVGAGVLTLGPADLVKMVSTMRALGADSGAGHALALARFGRFFIGSLWDTYVKRGSEPRR